MNAFAGLQISGGADTLALTTTAGKLVSFSAAGGSAMADDTYTNESNASIRSDATNNRVLVEPGTYEVSLVLSGTGASAVQVTAQLYKNGSAVAGCVGKNGWGASTAKSQTVMIGVVTVTSADALAANSGAGIAIFDAPSGQHAGGSGAPKLHVPLEVYLKSDSSVTCTFEEAVFLVRRLR